MQGSATLADITTRATTGSLSVSANNGTITQANATNTLIINSTSTLSASGDINLNNSNNNFTDTVTINNASIVTLNDTDDLTVNINNAITRIATNTSADSNITSNSASPTVLSAMTVGGNLDIDAAGGISQFGTDIITINDNGTGNGDGVSTLTVNDTRSILLGNANTLNGTVNYLATTGNIANLTVRDVTNSINLQDNLNITGALNLRAPSLILNNLSLGSASLLSLTADNGNIDQTAAISHAGTILLSATGTAPADGNINFSQSNNLASLRINNANTATIANGANAIILDGVDADNLAITATGGIIASDTINVNNTATFDAGTNALNLNNITHDFNNLLITAAGSVTIRESNDINIAGSMSSLDLTAGRDAGNTPDIISNINNTPLTVTGLTTLTLRDGGTINLNNFTNTSRNNLQGLITLISTPGSFDNISLRNTANIQLDSLDVFGALELDSLGTLSQTGIYRVAGDSSLQGSSILLNQNNDFTSVTLNSIGNVTLTDINDIELEGLADSLNITAGTSNGFSTITNVNAAALNVTNTSVFTLVNDGDINLNNNATNNLQGSIIVTSNSGNINNVNINNNSAVALSITEPVQNSLNITSMGNITQNSNFIVNGIATLESNNNLITLELNNDFNQVNVSNASTVTLNDMSGGISVTANNVSGTLDIDANNFVSVGGDVGALDIVSGSGDISNNGALTVTGSTILDAGNSSIIFSDTGNNLADITIRRANAVTIYNQGDIQISGTINSAELISGFNGAISSISNINSNSLNISGAANLITINDGEINLNNNATNNLQGLITIGSFGGNINNADINNASAVQLAGLSVQNDLTVAANGTIDQTGVITVNGDTTLSSNNNTIDFSLNNEFNNVIISNASDIFLTDTSDIVVTANTNISGLLNINANANVSLAANVAALTVTSNTGDIEDNGPIIVSTNTLLSSNGGDIIFDDNNNFNNVEIIQANDAQINDVDSINVVANNLNNLTVNAVSTLNLAGTMTSLNASTVTGNIEDSDVISVSGDSILNAGISDIIFNTPNNDFNTVTIMNAANANLSDISGITISAINVANNLNVNAGSTVTLNGTMASLDINTLSGGIIDNGIVTVNNSSNLNAGGSQIDFANNLHNFNNLVIDNASNVNVNDTNAINITASNVNGDMTVTAGNSVTVSGDVNGLNITSANGGINDDGNQLVVGGLTTLDAGNNNIDLSTQTNDFNQVEIAQAQDVTLQDANQLQILNTNVRDLNITNMGDLNQLVGTSITSTGNSILDAGTGNINLTENNLFTALTLTANSAEITNNQALTLNNSVLTDTLSITTNNGDLSINQINALNAVKLTAAGALLDATNDNSLNIISNSASLEATNGIGTGSDINVQLTQLSANNTISGDINIINSGGDITLNNITNNATDTGNFNFRSTDDVFIDDITLQKNLVEDFFVNGTGTGRANLFSANGSFLGVGATNINIPDITATNLRVVAVKGTLGSLSRNMVLDISGKVEITTLARLDLIYAPPAPAPADIIEVSTIDLTSSNVLAATNGVQVTEVETLLDIDPAIFTDIRHFAVAEEPLMLPRDQWFDEGYTDEDDEEFFRSINDSVK